MVLPPALLYWYRPPSMWGLLYFRGSKDQKERKGHLEILVWWARGWVLASFSYSSIGMIMGLGLGWSSRWILSGASKQREWASRGGRYSTVLTEHSCVRGFLFVCPLCHNTVQSPDCRAIWEFTNQDWEMKSEIAWQLLCNPVQYSRCNTTEAAEFISKGTVKIWFFTLPGGRRGSRKWNWRIPRLPSKVYYFFIFKFQLRYFLFLVTIANRKYS